MFRIARERDTRIGRRVEWIRACDERTSGTGDADLNVAAEYGLAAYRWRLTPACEMAGSVVRSCRNDARCHLALSAAQRPPDRRRDPVLLAVDLELGEAVDALANRGRGDLRVLRDVRRHTRRLGYVANSGARMLRRQHTDVVGLLLPDMTNEFYAAVAQRLAGDCGALGRELIVSISAEDPDRELALVRALLEARPSSLIAAVTPAGSRRDTRVPARRLLRPVHVPAPRDRRSGGHGRGQRWCAQCRRAPAAPRPPADRLRGARLRTY
jgi:hypothetical protein